MMLPLQPEKAKSIQERNRRKQLLKEKKDKQTDKDGGTITAATANQVEGEDLSAMDEDNSHSGAGMMAGKHRFD